MGAFSTPREIPLGHPLPILNINNLSRQPAFRCKLMPDWMNLEDDKIRKIPGSGRSRRIILCHEANGCRTRGRLSRGGIGGLRDSGGFGSEDSSTPPCACRSGFHTKRQNISDFPALEKQPQIRLLQRERSVLRSVLVPIIPRVGIQSRFCRLSLHVPQEPLQRSR